MDDKSIGATIAKVAALTGGAIVGAILINWWDKTISEYAQKQSDYDKSRYSQGLSPVESPRPQPSQPIRPPSDETDPQSMG
jgi:hypothetical protein